jgi:hypothetical protein
LVLVLAPDTAGNFVLLGVVRPGTAQIIAGHHYPGNYA